MIADGITNFWTVKTETGKLRFTRNTLFILSGTMLTLGAFTAGVCVGSNLEPTSIQAIGSYIMFTGSALTGSKGLRLNKKLEQRTDINEMYSQLKSY